MTHIFRNLLILSVTITQSLFGQEVQIVQEGPIHEAFVTRDTENFELDVVPKQPPAIINERIPLQSDRQATWIPGYWSWDENRNDFIWMSGIWRRPPPGHQWISGSWRPMDEGWVWISGFWSKQHPAELAYIDTPPPESVNENIEQPNNGEYCWCPGYWEFSVRGRGYAWVSGHWERLNPNWILVPARYVWYNDNYVFIPAHWDWRLEERGTVYSPVYIAPPVRTTIVYQPVVVVDNSFIIKRLYAYFPDYFGLFVHHHRYHPDFWVSFGVTPSWRPVAAKRKVVSDRGRRQMVNVRAVRQAPERAPVADRPYRQVPNGRAETPERPRQTAVNTQPARVQPGSR
jgi:hypothetical protein